MLGTSNQGKFDWQWNAKAMFNGLMDQDNVSDNDVTRFRNHLEKGQDLGFFPFDLSDSGIAQWYAPEDGQGVATYIGSVDVYEALETAQWARRAGLVKDEWL